MNNIKSEFDVISIDEANGTVAFVCLRFYALVLIKELDLDQNIPSKNGTRYTRMDQVKWNK